MGLTFALYREQTGGSPLWLETQNVAVDASGHFSVLLGSTTNEGLPVDLFLADETRWIGVKTEGQEELPRVLLVSVPYAFKAGDAQTLGGLPVTAFVQTASSSAGTSGSSSGSFSRSQQSATAKAQTGSNTGTQNFVAKWLDTTNLGNSLIFDNGSAVGINTTGPAATLDVNGSAVFRGFSTIFTTPLNNGPIFRFINAATPKIADWTFGVPGVANSTSMWIYDNVNKTAPFQIEQGALTKSFYIQKTGNVGIGTSAPAATLDVNGSAIFRGFATTFATSLNNGPIFRFQNTASPKNANWSFGVPGTANATSVFLYDNINQVAPFTVEQGATANSLYIRQGGNVGIGTTAPASKLSVAGVIQSTTGGFKFPDGSTLTSANNNQSITTSVTYSGSTNNQILYAKQNQTGVTNGFDAAGVPSGLRGDSTTTTGYAAGVFGSASSPLAPGVAGVNLSTCPNTGTCNAYGVFGWSVLASNGTGVWGQADATTGATNAGVYGESKGDRGTGVEGFANNSSDSGDATGVYGLTNSPGGAGVQGSATSPTTSPTGGNIGVYGSVVATTGVAGQFDAPTNGTIFLGRSGTTTFTKVVRIDSTGKGFFNGGTQTGGADFAESVDVLGGAAQYEPGDLMMIDITGDRRLALATGAYSTKVAGIYSTKPGVLATPHTMDDPRLADEVPLAIVGIVPCKVTTENGAIHAGDLLVTSSRPGYAMKGTDRRKMMGAVVGKALGSLDKGTGTIEVLVSLH